MEQKRKRRKLKVLPFILVCSFLVLVLGVGYVLANQFIFDGKMPGIAENPEDAIEDLPGRMNFLLMGIDAREGEKNTRTDSIILVSVDKEKNRIAMISLPRDTRVEIPGHGTDKINAANVYGGPELVMETVSGLTGVKIDHYLTTNVRGFRDIVDALGGVTIDVEKRMYHYDPYDEPDLRKIDLQPGVQLMDGDKALQYVRFRSDALGDVSRTERQQKFLKVLAQEMMQPSTITKLPKLVPTINKFLDTNLGIGEMITLAQAAKNLSNVEIVTQTMPGKFLDLNGVSYWSIEPDQAKLVAESIIREGKVYDVVMGAENVNTKTVAQETTTKPKVSQPVTKTPTSETGATSGNVANPQGQKAGSEKGEVKTETKKPAKNTNVEIIVNPQKETDPQKPGAETNSSGGTQEPTGDTNQGGTTDSESSWLPAAPL